ncbi:MAG: hypothetical protein MK135_08050 [Polyangiaceae bacterium]|nr:hypothetical protein [Polyangiaceae bacterium]
MTDSFPISRRSGFIGLAAASLSIGQLFLGCSAAPAVTQDVKSAEPAAPVTKSEVEPEAVAPSAPPEPPAPTPPKVQILADVGFAVPEAALHDQAHDVYLVSNINGAPLDKDDNGFISRITPEGEIDLKFIDGADESVELHAPKGLAIIDDTLYVADIDVVRLFQLESGKPLGTLTFDKARFLNALAKGPKNELYVSDTGIDSSFQSAGAEAIYVVEEGKIEKLASGVELAAPNGVLASGAGVWVVTFGADQLYEITAKGQRKQDQTLPGKQLDGIVVDQRGRLLISSWEKGAIFAGNPGKDFVPVVTGLDAPAAIGYDAKRDRILIPLFMKNQVLLHDLADEGIPPKEATPQAATPAPSQND